MSYIVSGNFGGAGSSPHRERYKNIPVGAPNGGIVAEVYGSRDRLGRFSIFKNQLEILLSAIERYEYQFGRMPTAGKKPWRRKKWALLTVLKRWRFRCSSTGKGLPNKLLKAARDILVLQILR
jgi:hypothetical protein